MAKRAIDKKDSDRNAVRRFVGMPAERTHHARESAAAGLRPHGPNGR
jgi:hypothetical protein